MGRLKSSDICNIGPIDRYRRQMGWTWTRLAEKCGLSTLTFRRIGSRFPVNAETISSITSNTGIPREILVDPLQELLEDVQGHQLGGIETPSSGFDHLRQAGVEAIQLSGFASRKVHQIFRRLEKVSRELGQSPDIARFGIWQNALGRAKYHAALELAIGLQHEHKFGPSHFSARRCQGEALFYLGQLDECLDALRPSTDIDDNKWVSTVVHTGLDPRVAAAAHAALAHVIKGDSKRSEASISAAHAIATRVGDFPSRVMALHFESCCYIFASQRAKAFRISQKVVDMLNPNVTGSRRSGSSTPPTLPHFLHLARICVAWSQPKANPCAVETLMSAFHDYRASGARLATSFWLVLAADLAISAGQENTALYFVENALEFAQICHEGFYLSEIYRKRARLRSRLRLEGVESDLTRAIDISVAQGARLFELRCAEDMSKFTKDKAVREQLERRIAQLKGLMAK